MAPARVKEDKAALRARCLSLRAALTPEEKAAADAALCAQIAAHPAFADADLLLAFSPVRGEPDLSPLFEIARKRGVKCAFPRCEGAQMLFYVADPAELETGRFGIPAPRQSAPLARPTAATLCLLPALAAAPDGARLGYGGGYYDRFLQTFTGRTLLPVYQALLFPSLPVEPTDMRAEIIVTEKGVIGPHA